MPTQATREEFLAGLNPEILKKLGTVEPFDVWTAIKDIEAGSATSITSPDLAAAVNRRLGCNLKASVVSPIRTLGRRLETAETPASAADPEASDSPTTAVVAAADTKPADPDPPPDAPEAAPVAHESDRALSEPVISTITALPPAAWASSAPAAESAEPPPVNAAEPPIDVPPLSAPPTAALPQAGTNESRSGGPLTRFRSERAASRGGKTRATRPASASSRTQPSDSRSLREVRPLMAETTRPRPRAQSSTPPVAFDSADFVRQFREAQDLGHERRGGMKRSLREGWFGNWKAAPAWKIGSIVVFAALLVAVLAGGLVLACWK